MGVLPCVALMLRHQNLYFRVGLMTLAVGQGVTGNTGMEWWLILASSRWHRWVRWSAPKGKPPTPGCRSSRSCLTPAPTADSSPYRWWLRSSRTNLQGRKSEHWVMLTIILFNYQIVFLCSIVLSVLCPELNLVWQRRQAGQCFPEGIPPHYISVSCLLISEPALASPSCSAHLPGLTWYDVFVRPPHCQPSWHFNLRGRQCAQCHFCLAEWAQ